MKGGGASVTFRTGSSVRLSLSGDIRQASGLIGGSSLSIPGAFGGMGRGTQSWGVPRAAPQVASASI